MNALKNRLIEELIEREGGYGNDPTDRGGETMYGITLKTARAHGYQGEMALLPYEMAFHIYQSTYWAPLKLDEVSQHSETLTEQLFDFGINSGVPRAAKALQTTLNVMNNRQTLFADLNADGIFGSRTLTALEQFLAHRKRKGLQVLTESVRGLRIAFCINIAVNDESQEKYQFGWITRIVEL